MNVCGWEVALVQIPCERVGGDKVSVHSSVNEEENWQSKAADVVTLSYTCCYFISIHELLCY